MSELAQNHVNLFLCGDVMTGRGIDQILPHPSDPILYESYVRSALGYVGLAEEATGPLPKPVDFSYVWGDALEELERVGPDARIINLETAVTTSDDWWRGKGINYRMHPENVPCLTAAGVDLCCLANNHTLDWGYAGLLETIDALHAAGVRTAGAGRDLAGAEAPGILELPGRGRVLVSSFGSSSSGIPLRWGAGPDRPGVLLWEAIPGDPVDHIRAILERVRRAGDVAMASIHWGPNWGYQIPLEQRTLAHRLIDEAGIDVIHGHSSHHVKGIEVYGDRPILYGCGDVLNDYEGISGYEAYRGDLALLYVVRLAPGSARLAGLEMIPMQVRHFRLNRASRPDAWWLQQLLNREGHPLGTAVRLNDDNTLSLQWS